MNDYSSEAGRKLGVRTKRALSDLPAYREHPDPLLLRWLGAEGLGLEDIAGLGVHELVW